MVDCTYEEKMIPKTIHYCWFGRNPKPKLAEKCIKSWRKKCPDYQIIEWNEDNFDISACPLYVRQEYEAKLWAFVSDYTRLKVVYDYGGIYLDTDVELRKNLDPLLEYNAYFGFDDERKIATGLGFGAEKHHPLLRELMCDYDDISLIREDSTIDRTPCPTRNTVVFEKHGLIRDNSKQVLDDNVLILPQEYLSPISFFTGKKTITKNTISIHWFQASWFNEEQKERQRKRLQKARKQRLAEFMDLLVHLPNRCLIFLLGIERYSKIKSFLKR